MNPNDLIDQATGRILASVVMRQSHRRAAFLARNGFNYRVEFAKALRESWRVARTYADCWRRERSTALVPMMFTGGRSPDGTMREDWV